MEGVKWARVGCVVEKWVIETSDEHRRHEIPVKRGEYVIGLRKLILIEHPKSETYLCHVCIDNPSLNCPTYLPKFNTIMSLKSYAVKSALEAPPPIELDYSESMEYFRIDFRCIEKMDIRFADNADNTLSVNAVLLLDLYRI